MNPRLIFWVLLTLSHNLARSEDSKAADGYNFQIDRISTKRDLAGASGFGMTQKMLEQDPLSQLDGNEVCEAAQRYAWKNGIAVRMRPASTYVVKQFGIFPHGTMNPIELFPGLRCPLEPTVVLRFADQSMQVLKIVIQYSSYLDIAHSFSVKSAESIEPISSVTGTPEVQRVIAEEFPLNEIQRFEACLAASARIRLEHKVTIEPTNEWCEIPLLYEIDGKEHVIAFSCHSSPTMYLSYKHENDTEQFTVMVKKNSTF